MNKKTSLFFLIIFFVVLSAARLFAASDKVNFAVVDIGKVFDEYDKTKDFDKGFQQEENSKQKERDAYIYEIRRLRDEQAVMAEDAKASKQAAIDEQAGKLEDFDKGVKEKLKQKRNDAVREVFTDIEGTLKQYGERKGYDFILNDRAVLYRPDNKDITQEVLKDLNEGYKKSGKKK